MDLLEYQGKQLFARHGLEVSDGRAVTTVEDAVAAANEIGYPVVVKAQVLIGGRGKAGGVKLADDEAQAREHASNILGLGHQGPHRAHALDRARQRHRDRVLRLGAAGPLGQAADGDLQRRGGRRDRAGGRGVTGEAGAPPRRCAEGAEPRGGRRRSRPRAAPTRMWSRAWPTRLWRCTRCGCRRTPHSRRSTP